MVYNLNDLVKTYDIDNEYEQFKRLEFISKLEQHVDLANSSVLEFGPAMGHMTKILSEKVKKLVAVDGSNEFIKIAREKVEGVKFVHSYFEDFESEEKFDCIIMHHIMEHVEFPEIVLSCINKLLKEEGAFAISVPNAKSLSRLLAVKMGLLDTIYHLSQNDICHGHYRVYDWEKMEELVSKSGFKVIGRHGLSLKLFSDKQNNKMIENGIIGKEQILGLWKLAEEIPEYAGAIMIVAVKG